jgi:hypothetical protein
MKQFIVSVALTIAAGISPRRPMAASPQMSNPADEILRHDLVEEL